MNYAAVTVLATEGEGFHAPGPSIFDLDPVAAGVTKPMLQIAIAAIVVFGFFFLASRKRAMVPDKLQYVGEAGYGFVRNNLGREIIGSHDFMRFVPYLFALFFFLLLNNLWASIPFVQFPTFSRAGMVYGLAALSWLVYNAVGIRKHGLLGYLKLQCVPSGVSWVIMPLLIPLEFFSNIIVRPVTLALRLLCNMFAGHLLLALFALGGEYLIIHGSIALKPVGILTWVLAIIVSFLELLIQFLQAYVFVLLNAMYISGALADEH